MHGCRTSIILPLLVACCLVAVALPQETGNGTPPPRDGKGRPLRNRPQSSYGSQTRAEWEGGGGVAGLWPYPQVVKSGSTEVLVSPQSFKIITTSTSSVLHGGIARYATQLLFPFATSQPATTRFVLTVVVASDKDDELSLDTDESYRLSVDASPAALLQANTVFGALHGLETFSQLIKWNDRKEVYSIPDLPIQITDFPRFPWRGILLDVSRHFLPMSAILRTLDAMSYNKLNVLHIHATDAQSIAIQSVTFPNLTQAAWSPKAIYTTSNLKQIVSYALSRGIRVVPEFEMPGHAFGFGVGYPYMVANCPTYTTDINTIPLNVASDDMYNFLLAFFSEMSTIFTDEFIHTGGDEVVVDCWLHDPAIKKWADSKNLTDPYRIFQYFSNRLGSFVRPPSSSAPASVGARPASPGLPPYVNRTMVVWQDVYDDNYGHLAHPEMVVEVFRDQGSIRSAILSGYRALYAYPYYLDQQQPGTDPKATFYEWVDTWQAFYDADPTTGLNLTAAQEKMCLGGEGSMWGENVDETNIDSRIWPRASAIAERLWSERSVGVSYGAKPRLINFRCNSLARRSIGAGPVMQDWCPLPSILKEGAKTM